MLSSHTMEAAALTKLHESLEAGALARGSHGGLGSQGMAKGKKRKAEESTMATATLLGGSKKGGANREFHSTTAGAVAAGHWDPWARPVDFKMKEVNTRVGGLYSMFVKGETVGGTLKGDSETAAPAKDGATDEKQKKRDRKAAKRAAQEAETASKTAPDAAVSAAAFNWKKAIKAELRSSDGKELPLKKLCKRAIAACEAQGATGGAGKEGLRALFAKKLAKTSGVETVGEVVRLSGKS